MQIGEVASFQNGYAFKSKDFVQDGKYKIIKIKELKDGKVRFFNDSASVNVDDERIIEKYIVEKEDVLFALTGDPVNKNNPLSWVGRVSVYEDDQLALLNQRVCKLVPKEGLNAKYIYYYFRAFNNFYALASIAKGSASQANISTKDIEAMEIAVPSLNIQNKIVSVLDSIEEKINQNNKINKNLEQQAQAIFDNMFPNISNGSCAIGDYITPKRGKSLLSKNAIFGDVPVIAGGLEPSTYHNVANTQSPVLAISASGANAGYVSLWNIPIWSSDSSYIDSSMTDDVYFWYVLLKKRQKEIFDAQTGSAQPHIYPQHIASMSVSNLDIEEVHSYTSIVTPIFEIIGHHKEENTRLASLRDTLLPKLMSGELDVSDIDL